MTMDYRSIIDGRRRDPSAFVLRGLLWCAQFPYWIVISFRNLAYQFGWLAIEHCDGVVVSIGNLTTGGTGKTPLVRYTARLLREKGIRVALISRGYGAGDGTGNDEAMELAATLPDVPHLQNPDRAASARIAIEELESQWILMDDGFQHRRLHRNLDVLVIDATCPFGHNHLLPRGLLREPVSSVRRAGAVVLTRSDAVDAKTREAIRKRVNRFKPDMVWAEAIHRPTGLLQWPNNQLPLRTLDQQPVALVCGIGNPDAFAETVRACGGNVVHRIELPDHAAYDQETLHTIRQRLLEWGDTVTHVVCTHKDLVKIQTDAIAGKPLLAIQIELAFITGKEAYDNLITQLEPMAPD